MQTDDQAATIAWLASPAAHGGTPVECVETHISAIFLAGDDAYKLKRAVRFDFLDFSTADLRRRYCEDEVRVNRRTAASLYHGVLPITREPDDSLAIGGTGAPVDWLVHMKRFDQSQLLDRLAEQRLLPIALMDALGRSIAAFHRDAQPRPDRGGLRGMQFVADGNAAELHHAGLAARTQVELAARREQLEHRRRHGFVRECHGDLHLGNIVVIDGRPTLFDAIEFNDDIACCDVLYDLAFVIMDLRHRGLDAHANALLNAYLEETADYDGLSLLPLFLSCRAAVRAKTSRASALVQHDAGRRAELTVAATNYLADAHRSLRQVPRVAVAIGGPSGSGKSTVAAALAPLIGIAPGAVVLRSDVIRKQLCGAGRFDRLGAMGYTSDMSARVYAELARRSRRILDAGHSVIVDATFLREGDRTTIEAAIKGAGVELHGFWLDAPDALLTERLRARQRDPSDADAGVLASQRRLDTGLVTWARVDAENSDVVEKILGEIDATSTFRRPFQGV